MPVLSGKSEFDSLTLMQFLLFIVVLENVTASSFQPVLDENRAAKYLCNRNIYIYTHTIHIYFPCFSFSSLANLSLYLFFFFLIQLFFLLHHACTAGKRDWEMGESSPAVPKVSTEEGSSSLQPRGDSWRSRLSFCSPQAPDLYMQPWRSPQCSPWIPL